MEAGRKTTDPADAASEARGLGPVPVAKRTLSGWYFASLWISLVVSVPSYYTAGSLVELGMSWWQGVATVLLGNLIMTVPICLNAHAGARYGISFTDQLRPAFGVRGAHIPALLRAVVACGWCGIESWIGGQAVLLLLPRSATSSIYARPVAWLGTSLIEFSCFILFSLLQFAVLWKGMAPILALGKYSSAILVLFVAALFAWAYAAAGSFGEMLSAPGRLSPAQFWPVFFPSLTGCVGGWASLALNISDFSRFARSQLDQVFGQMWLPFFMAIYTFSGLAITSATEVIFGRPISNPIELLSLVNTNFFISALAFVGIGLATITTNIPANFVATANVLVSLNPSVFSFMTGSLLTGAISILFQPWKLMASSESFVYQWLVGYSAVLGPIAGIMLTDYYVLRRSNLSVEGLYSSRADGPYYYTGGYNVSAFIALAAGMVPAIPGFLHKLGVIKITWKVFDVVYAGAWFFGFSFASLVYWVLTGGWRWVKCKAGKASTAESTMVEPLVRHTLPF